MIKYWRTFYLWKVVKPKNKENRLSDLEDESINKIAMVSCKTSFFLVDQWRASCENIFWSIDGEFLVRASCESIFGVDLLRMIEDLF
jgi:hypothetical protein